MKKTTKTSQAHKASKPKTKRANVAQPVEPYEIMIAKYQASLPSTTYLQQVIDPLNAPVCGYPDAYAAKTHVWRSKIITDITPTASGVNKFAVYPHPDNMFMFESGSVAGVATQADQAFVTNNVSPVVSYASNALANAWEAQPSNAFFGQLANGQTMYLFGNNQTYVPTGFTNSLFETFDTTGTAGSLPAPYVQGIKAGTLTAGSSCNTTFRFVAPTTFAMTPVTVILQVFALDPATGRLTPYTGNTTTQASPSTNTVYTLVPTVVPNTATYVSFISITVNATYDFCNVGISGLNLTSLYANDVTTLAAPDWVANRQNFAKVRCVGFSILISDFSSDLYNGGKITVAQVPGADAYDQAVTKLPPSYNYIAERPVNSYNGARKHGIYCFGKAEDNTWGQFVPIDVNDSQLYTQPTLEGVILFSSDPTAQGNQFMRAQVVAIFEGTTDSQIYGPLSSRIAPFEIAEVNAFLAQLPNCCENPIHTWLLGALKNAGRNVARMAKTIPLGAKAIAFGTEFANLFKPPPLE